MTLDYPSRQCIYKDPYFICERRGSRVSHRNGMRGKQIRDMIAGFENRRGPQTKECGERLEKGKNKETNSLEPLEGKESC